MADSVKAESAALPGLAGLIVESIPPRARKLVNAWVIGGAMVGLGRKAHEKYREHTKYQVVVTGADALYEDVQHWLVSEIPSARRRAMRAESSGRSYSDEVEAVPDNYQTSTKMTPKPVALLYDGATDQVVRIGGHRIKVKNERKEANYSGGGRVQEYESFLSRSDKLVFECQSPAARDAVVALLNELVARRSAVKRSARLYVANRWGGLHRSSDLRPRPLSTVTLPAGDVEALAADMEAFLAAESRYAEMGLPWHRGYLFHGPPGSGKTSLAHALASHFALDVYWVPIADIESDAAFLQLLGEIHTGGVLLLEDIDVLNASRDRDSDGDSVTMQGLLNGLDGMVTPHGLITVMTTNHRELLDEAVIRSGRADVEAFVGPLAGADLHRLLERFVGPIDPERVPGYLEAVPADVIELVKAHVLDDVAAREAVHAWLAELAPEMASPRQD